MTTDELEPPASDLQALLDAERAIEPLEREVSQRLAARLERSLGLPPVATSSAHPASQLAVRASGWTAARNTQLAIAFVLGAGTGTLITLGVIGPRADAVRAAHEPRAHQHDVLAPSAAVREPPARAAQPAVALAPRWPSKAPAVRANKPHAPDAGARSAGADEDLGDRDLGAERSLLELAHAALARGRAADALATLARHARRFPHGRLAEERESLRVSCLVVLGRSDQAKSAAVSFLVHYPDSLFAPGVRRAASLIP